MTKDQMANPPVIDDLFSTSQAEWVVKQKIVTGKCYFLCISDIFSTEALCRERVLNVSSEGLGFNPSLSHPKFLANLSNFLVSCISVSLSLKWGLKIIEVRTKRLF